MPSAVWFLLLLTLSNVFMTVAWYGHLKQKSLALWAAIVLSWLIAFFEYCFQVPANRIGYKVFSLTQLKVAQECITLLVFLVFATVAFKEVPRWNTLVSVACLVGAVYFAFLGRS
ncbi:MAG: membrane protein [Isosphaeraceae bacterium]|jgi:uncharacterized protein (DUF486 family)|nr:MAG: membrane protein [Isosphaeraceae bacterium]